MNKHVKLFEEFLGNSEFLTEGMMSEIDIIGQEATSKEEFKQSVKAFLASHAADKKVSNDENFLDELANMYFDEEGNKKD